MGRSQEQKTGPPSGLSSDLGWLIARTLRAHAQVREVTLAGFPGGPRGYMVLRCAGDESCGEKAHKQIDLARYLGIDRTVMVYLIDDLVKADLVERRPDPADRRNRLIVITENGQRRLDAVTAELEARDEVLLAPLAADERETLRTMLQRVATHADETDFTAADACRTVDEAHEIAADGAC